MNDLPQEKRIIRSSPGPDGAGKRLDLWLASRFTYRSRAAWQSAVRRGEILLNDKKTRPSRILHGDELVDFHFPSVEEPPVRTDFHILADFPDFIAVDKPGNLPVHPSGCFFNHTLLMLLRREFAELFPVNRLDRETSGVVLFAKTPAAAAKLSRALSDRNVEKRYVVYVHGKFPADGIRAQGYLSAAPESVVRKKRVFTFDPPEEAEYEDCDTEFYLSGHFGNLSKVECLLHTGRLHQIRATLCSLGFPVVGDKLYGLDESFFIRFSDGELTDHDRQLLLIDRQALHAFQMKMTSPFDGSKLQFDAPVPEEFLSLEDLL